MHLQLFFLLKYPNVNSDADMVRTFNRLRFDKIEGFHLLIESRQSKFSFVSLYPFIKVSHDTNLLK